MTTRHVVLTVGIAIAAWLALFGDKTPGGVSEPVTRKAESGDSSAPTLGTASAQRNHPPANVVHMPHILALQSREVLFAGTHGANQAGSLFGSQSWTPPPPPPPKPGPPPPPTAPPLPFSYLGKKIEDGKWEAYLGQGDQTFIVHEQIIVAGAYRIESIKPPTLSLTYLPLNQVQTLNIGGVD